MRSTIGSTLPMTRRLMFKHIRTEKNGTIKYRRRVPEKLQSVLRKREFVKVLGKTELEAMRNYQAYHEHVEQLLLSASHSSDASDLAAIKDSIEAQFAELGADPYSRGRTEGEKEAREAEADRLLGKYPAEPETGWPLPENLSLQDRAMVNALLNGVHSIEVPLTITQAFAFYLSEKKEPDPYKRKQQKQRLARVERDLLHVTKQDIALSHVSRAHARQVRDNLLQRMKVASAKRNLASIKAVFNLAIKEYSLNIANQFSGLDLPKAEDAAIDLRDPLPQHLIETMYQELQDNQVLLDIWTLLHHTGAQSAEVLGLEAEDLKLEGQVPYFEIKPRGLRTVKERSRIRSVPLVGEALQVASRLSGATNPGSPLFPKYAPTSKHDSFSQSLNKRLKKHTSSNKHVVYSLRHNMKDYLRPFGLRIERAIMGHADGRSVSEVYGSKPSLEELHSALSKVDFGMSR